MTKELEKDLLRILPIDSELPIVCPPVQDVPEQPVPARFEDEYPVAAEHLRLIARGDHPAVKSLHLGCPKRYRYRLWPVTAPEKVGRNDPCPCGSLLKFKKCHGK